MILIVGSEGSGKRTFAKSLGYTRIADGVLDDSPAVCHTEQFLFRNPDCLEELYAELLKKEAVLCCEVGAGIIPSVYRERLGREATGRLCCRLAAQADTVVRMVCGIPTVIKGSLPQPKTGGEY